MDYKMTRIKKDQITGVQMTDGLPFETIKNTAREWVEAGIADRVEVHDMAGQLVHHYPRITGPTPS